MWRHGAGEGGEQGGQGVGQERATLHCTGKGWGPTQMSHRLERADPQPLISERKNGAGCVCRMSSVSVKGSAGMYRLQKKRGIAQGDENRERDVTIYIPLVPFELSTLYI